jgi:hypothetical protein
MTTYSLTPVGINGPIRALATTVEGWDLRLIEENVRLRDELDEARRVAAGAQRLQKRFENECALRVRAQKRLNRVAETLASLAHAHPELADVVLAAREGIWRQGDA